MIVELKLRGFKAVHSAKLPLRDLTLLIGRNGSGKSTALEALQWLRDATFLGLDAATGSYTRYRDLLNRRSKQIELDLRFRRETRPHELHYVLGVEESYVGERPLVASESLVVGRTSGARFAIRSRHGKRGPTFRWVATRSGRPLVVRDDDELGLAYAVTSGVAGPSDLREYLSRAVFLRLSPTALATPTRNEPRGWRPILSEDGHDLPHLLERLDTDAMRRLVARIHSIFGTVRGVRVKRAGNESYFLLREHMVARGGSKTFDIPSWMLSEGMRRIVAVFALLEIQPAPSLLAIEEIENGLDPWTLQLVLEALRDASERMQILLTTHSPFLLDHVLPSSIVHVRRESGETTYERIDDLPEVAKFRGVLAPGAMYLSELFARERRGGKRDGAVVE